MYSIKPGRVPSLIGAIVALVIGVPFVIFWIGKAVAMKAPPFFVLFGVGFLFLLLVRAGIGFYNANARDRISEYDITTGREEGDPLNRLVSRAGGGSDSSAAAAAGGNSTVQFCPSCGAKVEPGFKFCPQCGTARVQPSGS